MTWGWINTTEMSGFQGEMEGFVSNPLAYQYLFRIEIVGR